MKLYTPPPPPTLMRINIKQQGHKTEHLTIEQTTQHELLEWLKKLIERQNLSIFATGKVTAVEVREGIGSTNGKSVSFSFKGLTPLDVKHLILKHIPN